MQKNRRREFIAATSLLFCCIGLSLAHFSPMAFVLSRYRDELSGQILGVVNSPFHPFTSFQVFIAWYYAMLGFVFLVCGVLQIWKPEPWCRLMTIVLLAHVVLDLVRIALSFIGVFGQFRAGEIYWAFGLLAVLVIYFVLAGFRVSAAERN